MDSYPTPAEAVHVEILGPHFLKVHGPDGPLHLFSQPDTGPAHDHPFSFTSHIVAGGYEEEEYQPQPDGSVRVVVHQRRPGTSHRVLASTVHRITHLPAGFCLTKIEPGEKEQEPGFFRFDEAGIFHRFWYEEPDSWQRWPRA